MNTDTKLPPLPEPDGWIGMGDGMSVVVPPSERQRYNAYAVFTAAQMREYARASLSSSTARQGMSDTQAQCFAYELNRLVGGDLEFSLDEAKAIHKTALLFSASGATPAVQQAAPQAEALSEAIRIANNFANYCLNKTIEHPQHEVSRQRANMEAAILAAAIPAQAEAEPWMEQEARYEREMKEVAQAEAKIRPMAEVVQHNQGRYFTALAAPGVDQPEIGAKLYLAPPTAPTPAEAPAGQGEAVPKWIDDPHDIEQGQMINPAWLKAHGLTLKEAREAHNAEATSFDTPLPAQVQPAEQVGDGCKLCGGRGFYGSPGARCDWCKGTGKFLASSAQQQQPVSAEAAQQAINALEAARNGLQWYRDTHPGDDSQADDEMYAQIDAAIAALTPPQAPGGAA